MANSFYSEKELADLGLKSYGRNVLISKKASIYTPHLIAIGNNVRVDDFSLLSGNIVLGDYVHIAAYVALFAGKTGIDVGDFAGISSRCVAYAESDDYSGVYLTNPMVPDAFKGIIRKKIILGRHVIVGTGSTILPGASMEEGVAVGAMSLVNKPLRAWKMYAGIPCVYMKERSKELLKLEKQFLFSKENDDNG